MTKRRDFLTTSAKAALGSFILPINLNAAKNSVISNDSFSLTNGDYALTFNKRSGILISITYKTLQFVNGENNISFSVENKINNAPKFLSVQSKDNSILITQQVNCKDKETSEKAEFKMVQSFVVNGSTLKRSVILKRVNSLKNSKEKLFLPLLGVLY